MKEYKLPFTAEQIEEKLKKIDSIIPVKGVDYWTDEDKNYIIQEVISAIDVLTLGSIDENNVINIIKILPAGTYTLRYENTDGTTSEIDNIVVR